MYYIYGISGPSLLIESTDSMMIMVDVDVLYLAVGIWQQRRCSTRTIAPAVYFVPCILICLALLDFMLCEITAIYIHACTAATYLSTISLSGMAVSPHSCKTDSIHSASISHIVPKG